MKSRHIGMRRPHCALLGFAAVLCAGCSSVPEAPAGEAALPLMAAPAAASTNAVPPMDPAAALAIADNLAYDAGVRWEDTPTTVLVEGMSYEEASARVGRDIGYTDPETRSMAVWLAASPAAT